MSKTVEATYYRGVSGESLDHLLTPSKEGTWGSGLYMADAECASNFADGDGLIAELRVRLRRPYYHACKQSDFQEHGELPAIPLVHAVCPGAAAIVDTVIKGGGYYFGTDIETALTGLGHDALIVSYPDRSLEVALYPPAQFTLVGLYAPDSDVSDSTNLLPDFTTKHLTQGLSMGEWYALYCNQHEEVCRNAA